MRKKPEPPARPSAPEKSPFEKMRDLTRRIINVPKSDVPSPKKPRTQTPAVPR